MSEGTWGAAIEEALGWLDEAAQDEADVLGWMDQAAADVARERPTTRPTRPARAGRLTRRHLDDLLARAAQLPSGPATAGGEVLARYLAEAERALSAFRLPQGDDGAALVATADLRRAAPGPGRWVTTHPVTGQAEVRDARCRNVFCTDPRCRDLSAPTLFPEAWSPPASRPQVPRPPRR